MAYLENQLEVKQSTIPGAGEGLFTKEPIKKNSIIVEYKGTVTTWKAVEHEVDNVYIYYINRNHVIDASRHNRTFGRYANDASGMKKLKGFRNNTKYVKEKGKVFLQAIADIPAGAEILVSYGKEYWDVIKNNHRLEMKRK